MQRSDVWIVVMANCVLAVLLSGCEINEDTKSEANSVVTISPVSVYLSAGKVSIVEFTASGGDSNYTWSVSSNSLGVLYAADAYALYQSATNAGINEIEVVDLTGNVGSATVTQLQQ